MFGRGASGGGFGTIFGRGYDGAFGGGGGFLPSQSDIPESTLRYGASGASAGGQRASGDSVHMYPYTVSLIKKSFQRNSNISHSDFFGQEVRHVFLVGLVRHLQIDEAAEKWTFRLDDGTGCILVEWSIGDSREYEEQGESQWSQRRLNQIVDNVYVDLRGSINMLGKDEPAIRAYNVKRVAIPEEIFAHQVHVAQEIVRIKFNADDRSPSPVGLPGPSTAAPSDKWKTEAPVVATSAAGHYMKSETHPVRASAQPAPTTLQYPTSYSALQPGTSSAIASHHSRQSAMAPGDSLGHQQNEEAANAVLKILRESRKPEGLTADELELVLQVTGHEIKPDELQRLCRLLVSRSCVYETEGGRWKPTNF